MPTSGTKPNKRSRVRKTSRKPVVASTPPKAGSRKRKAGGSGASPAAPSIITASKRRKKKVLDDIIGEARIKIDGREFQYFPSTNNSGAAKGALSVIGARSSTGGSKPGTSQLRSVNRMNADTYLGVEWKKGHLISNQLGGSGRTNKNLEPLSKKANAAHYNYVEKKIIDLKRPLLKAIKDQDQVVDELLQWGAGLEYCVSAPEYYSKVRGDTHRHLIPKYFECRLQVVFYFRFKQPAESNWPLFRNNGQRVLVTNDANRAGAIFDVPGSAPAWLKTMSVTPHVIWISNSLDDLTKGGSDLVTNKQGGPINVPAS